MRDGTLITVRQARRLALARAGLLKPEWTGTASRGAGTGERAHAAARSVIDRFGYLQLDTVSVAGARSHAMVLMSRLDRLDPAIGEALLVPGAPLFEYWGHEACWLPLELYPAFEFRRRALARHPWWGDVIQENREVVRALRRRIRDGGPVRSVDMEGPGGGGWWNFKITKRVAHALWSSGELAIRERRNFQRTFDLAERVIPEPLRARPMPVGESMELLILRALAGHGWATTTTIIATWRLSSHRREAVAALHRLAEAGRIVACGLADGDRPAPGWIRPDDLELAARLDPARPRADRGVLLSPFDPVLWDRARVKRLFGFDVVLEIYKPAPTRIYGYFCLPVLAGERLIARIDLKAERKRGTLRVLACHFEPGADRAADQAAAHHALRRFAGSLGLDPTGWRPRARRR